MKNRKKLSALLNASAMICVVISLCTVVCFDLGLLHNFHASHLVILIFLIIGIVCITSNMLIYLWLEHERVIERVQKQKMVQAYHRYHQRLDPPMMDN